MKSLDLFCLDPEYSTTRLLIREKPVFEDLPVAKFESLLFLPPNPERKGEGGLRTQGYFKKSLQGKPLITIITVVFNNAMQLEETILSVIKQTYDNIEYIIVDGGSSDGTIDVIKKYEEKIDYWISEKDSGLYFAMNKGISLAQGEWINFMNSGDSFHLHLTIDKVFSEEIKEGVIYGDVMFSFDGRNEVYVAAKPLTLFWKGMQFVHQASFVRKELMQQYPFDTKYRLIADYNSLYQMYLTRTTFYHKDIAICKFQAGGLSDNNPKSILECQRMIFAIHPELTIRIYYYFRLMECFVKYNFAKIIGQNNYAVIRRIKKWFY